MSKVRCEVIGPCAVAGVRNPGVVELDDEQVNIRALVRGGHVRLAAAAEETAEKPTGEKTTGDTGGKSTSGTGGKSTGDKSTGDKPAKA